MTAPITANTSGNSVSGRHEPIDRSGPRVEPQLPQVFGRYLLVQRLSRGGMGEIFLAKHGLSGFEKLCVIKKVLPHLAEDEQFISRFVDEAQVAIKLQHVNVAQVFEVGRVGNEYFLAIEYIEGRDLRRTLSVLQQRGQRVPVDIALVIAREVANGLAYAHRRTGVDGSSLGLVHCDVSPPNVVVSFEGETKVIDFGIAKSAIRATATDPRMGFGKFGYMAPEQLIRGAVVDHRTDIYAAGVVLYELLTGLRLYEAGDNPDYRALARKVARGEHKLPSEHDPALARFDELVVKALRPKPADRFQSAAELRDAIQAALIGVNPTVSTDSLGTFMQQTFADEMAAQRELSDRLSRMHLADYQAELTTQSVATVSFALANMPLPAPPTGQLTPEEVERALADGTEGTIEIQDLSSLVVGPGETMRVRRRRAWLFAGGVAATLAAGAVAFAVTAHRTARSGSATPSPAVAEAAQAKSSGPIVRELGPTVEPITQPADLTPSPDRGADKPRRESRTRDRSERADRDKKERRAAKAREAALEKPSSDKAAEPATDAAAVQAKFQSVLREYKRFKQSYGARLEQEWTELVTFAQYARSGERLTELDRRIDRFRAQMKAAQ
jgi:eukaryotic-like serine/threonine-protein kinase